MTQTDSAGTQLETLLGLVTVATQRLLGDTISVGDEDWRGPSRLPEWSRGHVATHIARQADGIVRLTEWARTGQRQDMYASAEQRTADIEAGSGRSGLDLQIDLDTSAGRLGDAFETLNESAAVPHPGGTPPAPPGAWDAVVELRGGLKVPTRLLPLARLLEVVVHHVDLDIGFEFEHIETATAEWLLEWCAFRLRGRAEFPKLELSSESGFTIALGTAGEPVAVAGSSANLLGFVMGRLGGSAVRGAEGLQLPAY
jgi:maleylpyruvate isomerase